MTERRRRHTLEWRVFTGLLVVSLASLAILLFGTVLPHLLAGAEHRQVVDSGWLVAAIVAAAVTAVLASVVVARRTVAPMERVLEVFRDFAAGDHSARVPDLGRPEFAELAETLNAAAREVQRSEEERRQLTADIAHELRTPLSALQAGLEELRDGYIAPTYATLAALHDQATRLGRVVADLSELSSVESERLTLTLDRVDLGTIVEQSLADRRPAMSAAGLLARTDVAPGVVVLGDEDRLHQVVGNLLTNSATYCRPGDTVEVRVRAVDDAGVLEVADDGPGMAPEEQRHAFDRMWRGRASAGTTGTGLGLPIVRALVTAQGGEVELDSASDAGTLVRVLLPLAQ